MLLEMSSAAFTDLKHQQGQGALAVFRRSDQSRGSCLHDWLFGLVQHGVCATIAGVADGVGSWIDMGVDAGIYARTLMHHAKMKAQEIEPSKHATYEVMEHAQRSTELQVCPPMHEDKHAIQL